MLAVDTAKSKEGRKSTMADLDLDNISKLTRSEAGRENFKQSSEFRKLAKSLSDLVADYEERNMEEKGALHLLCRSALSGSVSGDQL